jgi:hypothetical protein
MTQTEKPENPSAFPALHLNGHEGMTLRDYFAAKAMQGFTAKYGSMLTNYDSRAKESYKIADAMLNQREL